MLPGVWMEHLLLLLQVYLLLPAVTGNYEICENAHVNGGSVGDEGNITSPQYPMLLPSDDSVGPGNLKLPCRMYMTVCKECKIRLRFVEISLPNCRTPLPVHGAGCIYQCDHLYMHETMYPEHTTKYFFSNNEGTVYTTLSNSIYLIYCHSHTSTASHRRFRIEYQLLEKKEIFRGDAHSASSHGFIKSPNFPLGYARQNELYFYLIQNNDPKGLIRLTFDDWNLSPVSTIYIYYHNDTHPTEYLRRKGTASRPTVISRGPSLYMTLETGHDLYATTYMGFKARFEFVTEPTWPDKPHTDCGEYYYSLFGGNFRFKPYRCLRQEHMDCIWVIMKYKDIHHSYISVRVENFTVEEDFESLEVRAGNTSEASLMGIYRQSNINGKEFINDHGLYVRLRIRCSYARKFKAVFVSFAKTTVGDTCQYYYHFRCGNRRCITQSLTCDYVDHCGDGTDEQQCSTVPTTTKLMCQTHHLCATGTDWYCQTWRCDGKKDCRDGSDEQNCGITKPTFSPTARTVEHYLDNWGTYIPVGLISILLAIIVCIVVSCCTRRRQMARRRSRLAARNSHIPAISTNVPNRRLNGGPESTRLNISVEIQHCGEAPPSYDEAMQHVSCPSNGYLNLSYVHSDSTDLLPEPPPYTLVASDSEPACITYQGMPRHDTPPAVFPEDDTIPDNPANCRISTGTSEPDCIRNELIRDCVPRLELLAVHIPAAHRQPNGSLQNSGTHGSNYSHVDRDSLSTDRQSPAIQPEQDTALTSAENTCIRLSDSDEVEHMEDSGILQDSGLMLELENAGNVLSEDKMERTVSSNDTFEDDQNLAPANLSMDSDALRTSEHDSGAYNVLLSDSNVEPEYSSQGDLHVQQQTEQGHVTEDIIVPCQTDSLNLDTFCVDAHDDSSDLDLSSAQHMVTQGEIAGELNDTCDSLPQKEDYVKETEKYSVPPGGDVEAISQSGANNEEDTSHSEAGDLLLMTSDESAYFANLQGTIGDDGDTFV